MEELNEALFLWLNVSAHPYAALVSLATIMAQQMIWLVPVALVAGWLRGGERVRKLMLEATASGLAGLLINQLIGLVWYHPRPFEIGIGHTLMPHAADSSFPSDHLTLVWAVAFSFLLHERPRVAGLVLALIGIPIAWARIYLGVHFPLDMVGAALVALLSAWLAWREERWIVEPLFRLVQPIHERVFAPFIKRGWLAR